jgi:SAM-dependent methyltransferase
MHRAGWEVAGLDRSAEAARRLHAEHGWTVLAGALPHPALRPVSFDWVTLRQSLQQAYDPLEVLRAAYDLLVPAGRLLVGVPNLDGRPFRWFGNAWCGLNLPRHLTHFTPATLALVLERAGFAVRALRMQGRSRWLRASARRAGEQHRTPRWYRWLTSKPVARLAARYCVATRQADCFWVTAEKLPA